MPELIEVQRTIVPWSRRIVGQSAEDWQVWMSQHARRLTAPSQSILGATLPVMGLNDWAC